LTGCEALSGGRRDDVPAAGPTPDQQRSQAATDWRRDLERGPPSLRDGVVTGVSCEIRWEAMAVDMAYSCATAARSSNAETRHRVRRAETRAFACPSRHPWRCWCVSSAVRSATAAAASIGSTSRHSPMTPRAVSFESIYRAGGTARPACGATPAGQVQGLRCAARAELIRGLSCLFLNR